MSSKQYLEFRNKFLNKKLKEIENKIKSKEYHLNYDDSRLLNKVKKIVYKIKSEKEFFNKFDLVSTVWFILFKTPEVRKIRFLYIPPTDIFVMFSYKYLDFILDIEDIDIYVFDDEKIRDFKENFKNGIVFSSLNEFLSNDFGFSFSFDDYNLFSMDYSIS